jgi:hypothetical protein
MNTFVSGQVSSFWELFKADVTLVAL